MKVVPRGSGPAASPLPTGISAVQRATAKLQQLNQEQPSPVETEASETSQPSEITQDLSQATESPLDSKGLKSIIEDVKSDSSAPKEANQGAEEENKQPLSSQYAQLARKEKALRAKVQAQEASFKAKEAELKAKEEALAAKDAEYQSKYIQKDKISQDPWNTLQELGISYDKLTEMALSQPQYDPATKAAFAKLEAELKSVRDAQEKVSKTYEEQQKQSYQQAVNQIRNEAKSLVNIDANFEMIKALDRVDDVVELIEKTFKEDNVLLSVEEAAQAVEEELVEYASKETQRLSQLKKIQQRLKSTQTPKPQETNSEPKQPQQLETKTLTNSMGVTRKLTAKERAILAFKGQLK